MNTADKIASFKNHHANVAVFNRNGEVVAMCENYVAADYLVKAYTNGRGEQLLSTIDPTAPMTCTVTNGTYTCDKLEEHDGMHVGTHLNPKTIKMIGHTFESKYSAVMNVCIERAELLLVR
jgi:hypothetical protein